LPEYWRIASRRRYFLRRHQLQSSPVSFLKFYNFQRPHQGYCTKGRTPAEIFWGAVRQQSNKEAYSINTIPKLDTLAKQRISIPQHHP